MVEVVAALVLREAGGQTEFMICQRPEHKARGSLWEFVGGKIELGETPRQALARECREELGVSICIGKLYAEVTHEYPDLTIHLSLFECILPQGERPQLLEHRDLRWITPEKIPQYLFCPADESISARIQREGLPQITPLQRRLLSMQDLGYRDFQVKLMPTVDPERVIGVRTPDLRAFAKEIAGTDEAIAFLERLPHDYFEENQLHAFLLEKIGDFEATVAALDRFLPYIDNWATCDSLSPKCFRKRHPALRAAVDRWLSSPHVYAVRFAMKTLMNEFLGDDFLPSDAERLAAFETDEYYLQMMIAWYFATALAKRFDDMLPYFSPGALHPVVRKMALQKARDSFRLTKEQKILLSNL